MRSSAELTRTGEYVVAGTLVSLRMLKDVSGVIPVPFIQLAVTTACSVVDVAEGMRSNKEQRNELNARICSLMLVMITPLQAKREEEIPLDLKADIERLTFDLQHISDDLRKLSAQNKVAQFFFKDSNAEVIRRCLSRLDGSMAKFDVSSKIKESLRLGDISRKVNEIHEGLRNQEPATQMLPSFVMPLMPLIFHGRDEIVAQVADVLSARHGTHIAVLGHGGMGKTSVALAVVEHPTVVAKFMDSRFWVPCIEASSASRFLDILAASLRIKQATNDRLADILSELKTLAGPLLILLDNFETPWNLPGSRPKIEHVICALANLPEVALLVTMRSNAPPSQKIKWAALPWTVLPALREHAARQVYIDIHSDAELDPALDALLRAVGYMPLAITLMAKVGSHSGDMPNELLKQWNDPRIRTRLLVDGLDSENDINISIQLSVNSQHMQANPNAITLLTILSMLPGGARRDFLSRLAPDIPNISGALSILSQASLVEQRPGRSIHVQPVISSYMLLHHPPSLATRQALFKAFHDLITAHKSEPGDPHFDADVRTLADEETNMLTIFTEAAKAECGQDTLDALLSFSWYQHWTRPRADVIQYALEAAKGANNTRCVAEALRCQGHMFHKLDRYEEASDALKEARESFQKLCEPRLAAQCLLKLSEVYGWMSRSQDRFESVKAAEMEFRDLGDRHGVANSLEQLGAYYYSRLRSKEAHATLEEARRQFLELEQPLGAAHCLRYIARTYLSQGHYKAAREAAQEARQEYQHAAYSFGAMRCLISLGASQVADACQDDALQTFRLGLDESRQLGSPLLIAQCLEALGYVYRQQLLHDEACRAYKESREHYQRITSSQSGRGAAHCLERLGDIYSLQEHRAEAIDALEKACEEYRSNGCDWLFYRCSERLHQVEMGPGKSADNFGHTNNWRDVIRSIFSV